MRPQNDIDFTTLTWVKGELDETLKQARNALEAFVEDPSDASQMRFCATYLHQVQGTLRMVELYGAAMVTEEMERLAGALLDGTVPNRDDAYGVLMRGIMQLPDYLERLQAGHKDIPIVLLPLLNELREVRGEKGLTEVSLFTPNLARGADGAISGPAQPMADAELRTRAGMLRGKFQIALLKWFKGENIDVNLAALTETGDELARIVWQQDARTLFWVTAGVLEALRARAFEPSQQLKQTIGKVEREIKRLADGGEAAFKTDPPRELTHNLLYFVAHAPTEHGRIAQMRELFDLQALLPSQEEIEHARGSLSGHTRSLLGTVSAAIKEDILRVKDALDLFLRSGSADPSGLSAQADVLDRVSDTLGMLGLGVARRVVQEQRDAVRNVVAGSRAADESSLLDIAGALLYVEASLDDQVQHLGGAPGRTEDAASPLPAVEQQRVMEALVKEAQTSFGEAKQCFVAFIEAGWNHAQLEPAPSRLTQVAGALRIIERTEAADYLDAIAHFTRRELLGARRVPNVTQMETLADALASIEYFLEALYERRPGGERVLATARTSLEKLGYWPVPSESEAPAVQVGTPSAEPVTAMSDIQPVQSEYSSEISAVKDVPEELPETPMPVEPIATFASPEIPVDAASPVEPAHPAQVDHVALHAAFAGPVSGGFEAASEEIDEEIREVFVEEVAEEIANLDELLPAWAAAPQNLDQLKSIRRVFHTLKGSGRLVGALTLGEFSWKIENMLNRVLDHTIQPTSAVVEMIEHAHRALPELLGALRGERGITADLEAIKDVADRVAAGEQAHYVPRAAEPEILEVAVETEAVEEAATEAFAVEAELASADDEAPETADAEPETGASETAGEAFAEEPESSRVPVPVIDPVLFDILKGEVNGHLETVDAYLACGPVSIDENVLRAVHTMNGAFAMTDVPVVTDVLAPLEGYFKRLRHSGASPSAEGFAAIGEAVAAVRTVLFELEKPDPRLHDTHELALRIIAERDALPESGAPTVPVHLPGELHAAEAASDAVSPEVPVESELPAEPIAAAEEAVAALDDLVAAFSVEPAEPVADAADFVESGFVESGFIESGIVESGSIELDVPAEDSFAEEIALPELSEADAQSPEGFDLPAIELPESVPLEEAVSDISSELSSAVDIAAEMDAIDLAAFEGEIFAEAEATAFAPAHEPRTPSMEEVDFADLNLGDIDIEAFAAELETAGTENAAPLEGLEIREREDEEAAPAEVAIGDIDASVLDEALLSEAGAAMDAGDAEVQRLIAEFENAPTEETSLEIRELDATVLAEVASAETADAEVAGAEAFIEEAAALEEPLVALETGEDFQAAEETLVEIAELTQDAEAASTVEAWSVEVEAEPAVQAPWVEDVAVAQIDEAAQAEGETESEAESEAEVEAEADDEIEASEAEEALIFEEPEESDFVALGAAAAEAALAAEESEAERAAAAAQAAATRLLADAFVAGLDTADSDPDGPLQVPDMDEELLDIFLEEGTDILDHSDGLMARLREDRADLDTVVGLQRDLHTLKGGARMSGLVPIGDLGHIMESLLESVANGEQTLPAHGIDLLDYAFDRLNRMVKRVGERQSIAVPALLMERIEMLARGELPQVVLPEETTLEGVAEPSPVAAAIAAAAEVAAPEAARAASQEPRPILADDDDDIVVRAPQEQIRIRADLLDRLVNYAGEVAIYRARLEQQLGLFRGNLAELEQTTERLRGQLRKLEIETEAQIASRYQREAEAGGAEVFDPLELDRFSTLQQLTRALSESAADLSSLKGSLEDHTRQYETLLLQQSRVSSDLQEGLMRTRMVPFDSIVPRLRRIIRQTSAELGKKAALRVEGAQGEMDRNVLDRMTAPLEHMLRNSIAHGFEDPAERLLAGKPEEGTVRIQLLREGSEVVIKVSDDGRGLNREAIRRKAIERGLLDPAAQIGDREMYAYILHPGFSTAESVSKIAGRGVGMDVVHSEIRQLGGLLQIDSEADKGTVFTIRLPFTLAVTQAVFLRQGETTFAVPIASVQGVARIDRAELDQQLANGGATFRYAGEDYEIHDLGRLLGASSTKAEGSLQVPLLLARSGDHRAAITVDHVIGSREIVVKPVGAQVSSIPGIFGATIMGDGRVIVILDVVPLVRRFVEQRELLGPGPVEDAPVPEIHKIPLVMVVDDSITMRKVTGRVLERHGYEVMTAKDGVDAVEKLVDRVPDVMLLDIEMPRMDGYELATHIRNDVRLRGIPIIMITSRTGDKHRQRAFEIGVDRYLGKPYQEADLMRNVEEILKVGRD